MSWAQYYKVADKFLSDFTNHLEKIEKGEEKPLSWRKTWINSGFNNPLSNHKFSGNYNLSMLSFYSNFLHFSDTRFITFNQLRAFNKQNKTELLMKKGSSGVPMLFPMFKKTEDEKSELIGYSSYYVFNLADVVGYEEVWGKEKIVDLSHETKNSDLYQSLIGYLNREKISINYGGNKASYSPSTDSIKLPHFGQFEDDNSFLITMGHEIAHSTGAKKRINRELSTDMQSQKYAREELLAESTGYTLVSAHREIDNANSLAYVSGWKKHLSSFSAKDILKLQSDIYKTIEYILK